MTIKITIRFILFFVLASNLCCMRLLAEVSSPKNVLVLSGFGESVGWTNNLVDLFHENLHLQVPGNVNLYAETFDWRLLSVDGYEHSISELINSKYKNTRIDMALIIGLPAYSFARDYLANSLFMNVPVVYCYTDGHSPVLMKEYIDLSSTCGHCPVSQTMQIAKTFLPNLSGLLLVGDDSISVLFPNIEDCSNIENHARQLGLKLEMVTEAEYSTSEMLAKISNTGPDTAIILVRWQNGLAGEVADEYKVCRDIVEQSPVPVFTVSSDYLGQGVIGGNVVSLTQIAEEAAGLASIYINDQQVVSVTESDTICRNVFDLNSLLRWNISVSAIPVGSDIFEAGGEQSVGQQVQDQGYSSQELQWLDEGQKATFAVLVRPPLVMPGEPPSGFAIDYIELLSDISGIDFEYDYSYRSVSDYLSAVKQGLGPLVVSGMENTLERNEYIDFTEPWLSMHFTLFVRVEYDMLFYDGPESLAGRKIAVEKGSRVHELMVERYGFIELLPVDNAIDGLRAVSQGLVFGWLGDHSVGLYTAKSEGFDNVKVGVSVRELGKHNLSIGVVKGNPLLSSVLQKTMAKVPAQELDRIRQKYNRELRYTPGLSVKFVSEVVAIVMLVFSMLLFLVNLRIRKVASDVRQSKENLRIAFESIADAVIVTDLAGKIKRINRVAVQLTGFASDDAIGEMVNKVFDIIDPVTLKPMQSPLDLVLAGKSQTGELMAAMIASNGRRYYISYSASMINSKAVTGRGMVLIFRDITSGFEMERRMKRAEKERELILDNITVGVCYYDEHFFPIRYNKQMEKYYNELIGTRLDKFQAELPDSDSQSGELTNEIRKFNISKPDSGTQSGYELEVTAVPVVEANRVIGVLEVVVDVTEYRRLQQELEQAYEKLRSYSGGLEDMVRQQTSILEDRNMQLSTALEDLKMAQGKLILSVKMAALGQLITGIAHEINAPLGVIGASEGIIAKSMEHLVSNIIAVDKILTGENASLVNKLLSQGVVHRRDEDTLTTRQERELRKQLSAELFTAGITENNDYIASFLIGAGAIENWRDYLPVLQQENYLEVLYELSNIYNICTSCKTVNDSVVRASRIVTALKSYVHKSNYDSSQRENVVFDLTAGLENVFILFDSRLKDKIKLSIDIKPVPGVRGMPDELNQVWTNLIQNAIEAMPDGGEFKVNVCTKDDGVLVSMADIGCGMSKETQERIFEPHFSTRPAGTISGLGMDIVKRIVEDNYNGRITVESELGKGTIVSVWLPTAH